MQISGRSKFLFNQNVRPSLSVAPEMLVLHTCPQFQIDPAVTKRSHCFGRIGDRNRVIVIDKFTPLCQIEITAPLCKMPASGRFCRIAQGKFPHIAARYQSIRVFQQKSVFKSQIFQYLSIHSFPPLMIIYKFLRRYHTYRGPPIRY